MTKYFSSSLFLATVISLTLVFAGCATAKSRDNTLSQHAVQTFIDMMVEKHDFNRAKLETLFSKVHRNQTVIDKMNRPAEALPWYRYRSIFLTGPRAKHGAAFLADHKATLARAEKKYGVPPAIITAIIGIESSYGERTGTYNVFDTLATLAFDYPSRADFFRKQLIQFLLLSRAQHFDTLTVKGSYAGAMGALQFIPSSYRHYAVDFDGDGQRNLWNNWPDIIGSVANYLAKNGWQRGATVATPTTLEQDHYAGTAQPMTDATANTLRQAGFQFDGNISDKKTVTLIALDAQNDTTRYWIGLHNFDVIMSYNHSPLYAMAVYQLSQAIKQGSQKTKS